MLYIKTQEVEGLDEAAQRLRSTLSAQIRMWMDRDGVDVKSLAKMSSVSDQTIYRLRAGSDVATDKLAKIAHALNIPPAVLLMSVE